MTARALLMAAGSSGSIPAPYIDDVFATDLYTSNGANRSIVNGIDIAGSGGLVWIRQREAGGHALCDTVRGRASYLRSHDVIAQQTEAATEGITSFNSNGFTLGLNTINAGNTNANGGHFVAWTFRRATKFFDIATWTGDGSYNRSIPHSLGIEPGMIVVKAVTGSGSWYTYHRYLGYSNFLKMNLTDAAGLSSAVDYPFSGPTNQSFPSATTFLVGGNNANATGVTYIAYLFAHDTAADGIIRCNYFQTDGSGTATIDLGWEPQFVMVKQSAAVADWTMIDNQRGWSVGGNDAYMAPNTAVVEASADLGYPTATGMVIKGTAFATYVYVAIRRPNKPVTSGTQVFNAVLRNGTSAAATVTFNSPVDLAIIRSQTNNGGGGGINARNAQWYDRLRGPLNRIGTATTSAEDQPTASLTGFDVPNGFTLGADPNNDVNSSFIPDSYINYAFRRAPGVFDMVCYTGTGAALVVNHNLGVAPEIVITKSRSSVGGWTTSLTSGLSDQFGNVAFNSFFFTQNFTSTTFTAGIANTTYTSSAGVTYVAYLFATKAGISKVGTYTGNGASLLVDCGFTTGARFAMIKRTDAVGDWFVFDTVRGISASNDPVFPMNSYVAPDQFVSDAIDPHTSGFLINQDALTNLNVNGASYFYIAFA